MTKHIFWLASYPKSGNTLIRLILAGLFFTKDGIINIGLTKFISNFESTNNLNFIKSKNEADFNNLDDLKTLSKYYLETQSKKNLGFEEDFAFFKTHTANLSLNNNPFTILENLRGFIYVIRDPRDIVISWSHYSNTSIEDSINFILNDNASTNWIKNETSFLNPKIIPKVYLSSWDKHVESWIHCHPNTPKLIIKYEDIVYKKEETILRIINFFYKYFNIKFIETEKKIKNLIITSNFKNLQNQEKEKYTDKFLKKPFFRTGKSEQWKKILSNHQIKLIENKFKFLMQEYSYI